MKRKTLNNNLNKRVSITLYLPKDLAEKIRKDAKRQGLSIASYVRMKLKNIEDLNA